MFLEFGQLVQKQNSVMGHADLAGSGIMAPANQSGIGNGVMGGTERASGNQGLVLSQHASHTENFGGLDGLVKGKRGQNGG